jgi:RHS repeat-associated protein
LKTNLHFAGRVILQNGQAAFVDRVGSDRRNTRYYPYGEEYTATANDKDKFATYFRDSSTGLDYAMNRYYGGNLGRFLSPDPYRSSTRMQDPQGWNPYAYVQNDPVNYSDPLGLDRCPDCSIEVNDTYDRIGSILGPLGRLHETTVQAQIDRIDRSGNRRRGTLEEAVADGQDLVFRTDGKLNDPKCKEIFAAIGLTASDAQLALARSSVKDGFRDTTPIWIGDKMTTPKDVLSGGWPGLLTGGLLAPNSQELTVTDPVTNHTTIYLHGPKILSHRSSERTAALLLHGGVHAFGLSDPDILSGMKAHGFVVNDSNDFTNYLRDRCF